MRRREPEESSLMLVVSADVLRRQLAAIFKSWGMSDEHVETTVTVMVETDLTGIDSHGVGMIPGYQKKKEEGRINPRPNIRIEREKASVALIDADRGLGHPPSVMAMELAIAKAKKTGIGVVGVHNSNHFGAAGYYSQLAARNGVIGMAMTASSPIAVPTFGREPMFGTNPIAFAAPAARNKPFSLDMATTTVAFGKINIARRAKKPLPVGWALDKEGRPLTDSQVAFETRRQTPLGGTRELGSHKGYGLAMMVEILSSLLGGSYMGGYDLETGQRGKYINVGHFFLALDPAFFRGDLHAFTDDLDDLIDLLHATPPADPAQPVLVAGEPEHKSKLERAKHGIPMTPKLLEEVRAVAHGCGAEFLLGD